MIIESIFGKSSGLKKEDIEEKIIGKYKESSNFECKAIDLKINKDGITNESLESAIIKPLVGFLNSISGTGLLCLGIGTIDGKTEKIIPIKRGIIKSQEQLRAIILSNIKSIPVSNNLPELIMEEINIDENAHLFLVEIKRLDDYCIYYSKITDYAYLRQNDETKRLTLLDTLDFLAKKNFPRVFVRFDKTPTETNSGYEFTLSHINEGLEPGRYITTLMRIFYNGDFKLDLDGDGIGDITDKNIGSKKAYRISIGYPPDTILAYPNLTTIFGKLRIYSKEDFLIQIKIETYENRGKTEQMIIISNFSGNLSINETMKTFKSYLI